MFLWHNTVNTALFPPSLPSATDLLRYGKREKYTVVMQIRSSHATCNERIHTQIPFAVEALELTGHISMAKCNRTLSVLQICFFVFIRFAFIMAEGDEINVSKQMEGRRHFPLLVDGRPRLDALKGKCLETDKSIHGSMHFNI